MVQRRLFAYGKNPFLNEQEEPVNPFIKTKPQKRTTLPTKGYQATLASPSRATDLWSGLVEGLNKIYAGAELGHSRRQNAELEAEKKKEREDLIRGIFSGGTSGSVRDTIAANPSLLQDNSDIIPILFKLNEKQKANIIEGADGYKYDANTGQRILPDVEKPVEWDELTGKEGFIWRRPKGSTEPYQKSSQVDPSFKPDKNDTEKYGEWKPHKDGGYYRTNKTTGALEFKPLDTPPTDVEIPLDERKFKLDEWKAINAEEEKFNRKREVQTFNVVQTELATAVNHFRGGSPVDALMLYISAYKAKDPTSIVRESEIESVRSGGSLPDRVAEWVQKEFGWAVGQTMTQAMKNQLMNSIIDIYEGKMPRVQRDIKATAKRMKRLGYNDAEQELTTDTFNPELLDLVENRDKLFPRVGVKNKLEQIAGIPGQTIENNVASNPLITRGENNEAIIELLEPLEFSKMDEEGLKAYAGDISNLAESLGEEGFTQAFPEGSEQRRKLSAFKAYYERYLEVIAEEEKKYASRRQASG